MKKDAVYLLKLKYPKSKKLPDRSVAILESILDDLGNHLDVMVFFRETNTFGKVEITEL